MNSTARTTFTSISTTVAVVALTGLFTIGAQSAPAPTPQIGAAGGRAGDEGCHLSQEEVTDWGDTSAHLQAACDKDAYTVLDHPSLPCHLSKSDVANWGETSAHLPLACSYHE